MKYLLFGLILSLISVFTQAAQVTGIKTVNQIFTVTGARAGFSTVEGLPAQCTYGLMYIDLTQPSGKAQLAQVLTAKTAGHKIVRLDYTINPDQLCFVLRLFTE